MSESNALKVEEAEEAAAEDSAAQVSAPKGKVMEVDFTSGAGRNKVLPKAKSERVLVYGGVVMDPKREERRSAGKERMAALKELIGDEPVTGIEGRPVYRFVKRAFDIVFSAAVLVCFSWLFAIIAIAIKIDDPKGPVFFKQKRCGKLDAEGNPTYFQMYKFRSMCVDAEEKLADLKELNEKTGPVFKMANDPRITRVGKVLRKLSLDELPQFAQVVTWACSAALMRSRPMAAEARFDEHSGYRFRCRGWVATGKVRHQCCHSL